MAVRIPLHSLVLAIGDNPHHREEKLKSIFPAHEVMSQRGVLRDLIGSEADRRHDLLGVAEDELRRRAAQRLSLGERVVLNGSYERREDRENAARLGRDMGLPVVYLLHEGTRNREVTRGDGGTAEVIDMTTTDIMPVRRIHYPIACLRERHYRGITAVGDLHGSLQALQSALRWARSRQHFVIFLGDLLSYGPSSLAVADEVHRLVMAGEAAFLMGNHERKVLRWLDRAPGREMRLSDGNRVTTQAISALSTAERQRWIGRFRGLVQHSELVIRLGPFCFAHAAIHPGVWSGLDPRLSTPAYEAALFGEFENSGPRFALTYRWVDAIPAGCVAIVGHDIRSRTNPVTVSNERGGKAVFIDTGCGKGGRLSTADIRFVEDGMLKLENFNMH